MKVRRLWMLFGIVLGTGVAACAGTSPMDRSPVPPDDAVIGLLSKGITQLNLNINALSKRMNDTQQTLPGTDPVLGDLQLLDLSGWRLHQQQLVLHRDHLVLAHDSLQKASSQPGQKAQLLDQWRQHQRQYVRALEELRQQRRDLENEHLKVESRLVERGLQ